MNKSRTLGFHSGGSCFFSIFALVLASSFSTALGSPVEDLLTILVHLQFHDGHLGGMDTDVDRGTVSLLPLDALNVHAELFAVALDNLADLLALVMASDDLDFIVFTDGDVPIKILTLVQFNRSIFDFDLPHSILLTKILGQRSSHQLPLDVGRSTEVAFALLLGRRSDMLVQLHVGSTREEKPVSVLFPVPTLVGEVRGVMIIISPGQLDGISH